MRVLIYKRTHVGDPNPDGVFGCADCLGSIRSRSFDAVIGLGGIGAEAQSHGIAGKINWIGIGAHKTPSSEYGFNKPYVTFDHFCLMDHRGPEVASIAPGIAKHMYEINRRTIMSDSLPANLYQEVLEILSLAKDEPGSSQIRDPHRRPQSCAPRTKRKCR